MTMFSRGIAVLLVLLVGLFLLPSVFASAPSTNIAYVSVTGAGSEFRMIRCQTDACDISTDNLLTTDTIHSYAIVNGSNAHGVIAYLGIHGAKKGLFLLQCTTADCAQFTLNRLVEMPSLTGDLSLVIRPNGTPFITYFNTNDNLLHAYACDDSACKSGKDRVLDTQTNNGPKSVVKITPAGFPAVLYWGAAAPLHFLFCQDADCTASTTTILNNAMYTTDMDFVYGSDGFPVVTFDNLITGMLKITHCGNATCTSGNVTKQIGVNAMGARLAINRPGTPFLFYVQQSTPGTGGTHDVKAMKCTTFTCTGPTWNTNFGSTVTPTLPNVLMQANEKPILIFSRMQGWNRDIEQWTCNNFQCTTYTSTLVTTIHSGTGFSSFNVKAAK